MLKAHAAPRLICELIHRLHGKISSVEKEPMPLPDSLYVHVTSKSSNPCVNITAAAVHGKAHPKQVLLFAGGQPTH